MNDDEPDYSWTTERDPQLAHRRFIGRGGGGEVHEVLSFHQKLLTRVIRSSSAKGLPRDLYN